MSAPRRANAVRPYDCGGTCGRIGVGAGSLGQLLVVRLTMERWSSGLERWLRRTAPAGIVLSPRCGAEQSILDLLRHVVQALPAPPFLLLGPESGALSPLPASFRSLPSPAEAAQQGANAVERLGELTGATLRREGFNALFAPLLDLLPFLPGHRLARQAFGPDPASVARCGRAFLRALGRQKVLACAAHFPGLGEALLRRSCRVGLPVIGKSMAELWRADLVPFRQLLPRLALVKVSPVAYKAFDFDLPRPALFSEKVVEGLLRTKLSYEGVALADLEDALVRPLVEPDEAALRALQAGCDLVVFGCEGGRAEKALARLEKAVESGELPLRRAEQALRRVRRAKRGLAVPERKIA